MTKIMSGEHSVIGALMCNSQNDNVKINYKFFANLLKIVGIEKPHSILIEDFKVTKCKSCGWYSLKIKFKPDKKNKEGKKL